MSKLRLQPLKKQDDFTTALNDLIQPFNWKTAVFGSHCVASLTDDERQLIVDLINDQSDKRRQSMAALPIPTAFWQIMLIPISAGTLQSFSKINDAKALACFLVPSTARLFFWRSLSKLGGFNDTTLRELMMESFMALPASLLTPSGAVYQECDGRTVQVWFGKKAGRPRPDLVDDEVLKAIRVLFSIGGF
jgi:hypothetical protein